MIDLYTAATPNGHKISIALEELGLPTRCTPGPRPARAAATEFLAISRTAASPAIVDREEGGFRVFESGRSRLPRREDRAVDARRPQGPLAGLQWLMFQMGGIGR